MFNSSSYGGMKADEKPGPLNQTGLSGYLQGISSYIPNSIKSTIKKQIYQSPSPVEGDKDTIVGTYFDECEILGQKHKLLNICYNNGFQIWDLDHPDGVKEIFSLREGMTRLVKVLTTPAEKESPSSIFYGKRPLLAVVSGEDNPKVSRNMVRIFSLKTTELVNMSKFRTPVYNVISNEKIVLVCLKERIVGFDPVTMSKLLSLPCYPSVSPSGVVALGSRWLAYTDAQPVHHSPPSSYLAQLKGAASSISNGGNQQQSFDNAVDVATDLAKEVAQKLYYFGDIGRKKVSSYLYPDDIPSPSGTSPNEFSGKDFGGLGSLNGDTGCVIIIFDFIKQQPVCIIKPQHNHPISYLNFDPSGTLLFSSSTEGTKINVYQIIPYSNSFSITSPSYSNLNMDPSHSFRHIYVLKRGITNASIQGISINDSSKWVAITTSRGTTHLYAINPLGGDVNIHSHITRGPNHKKPYDYFSNIPNYLPSVITLNAMDRIKLGNFKEENPSNKSTPSITTGNSCFVESTTPNLEQLYVVNQAGQLLLYEIRPQTPTSSEMDPNTLCLSLQPIYEWDICRKTRYEEFKKNNIPYTISNEINPNENNNNNSVIQQPQQQLQQQPQPPQQQSSIILQDEAVDTEARWLYNVEITTHSQDIRAIWGVPQFSFRNSLAHKPSPDSQSFFDEDYPIGDVIKFEKKRGSAVTSPRADLDDGTVEMISNISDIVNNQFNPNHNNNNINNINNINNTQNLNGKKIAQQPQPPQQPSTSSLQQQPALPSQPPQKIPQYQFNVQDDYLGEDLDLMKQLDQAIKTPITNGLSYNNNAHQNQSFDSITSPLPPLNPPPSSSTNSGYPPQLSPFTNNPSINSYGVSEPIMIPSKSNNIMIPTTNGNKSTTIPVKSTTATSIYSDSIYGEQEPMYMPNNNGTNNTKFTNGNGGDHLIPIPKPLPSTTTPTNTPTNGMSDLTSLYPPLPKVNGLTTTSSGGASKKQTLDIDSLISTPPTTTNTSNTTTTTTTTSNNKTSPMPIVSPSNSSNSLSSSTSSGSSTATSPPSLLAVSPNGTTGGKKKNKK